MPPPKKGLMLLPGMSGVASLDGQRPVRLPQLLWKLTRLESTGGCACLIISVPEVARQEPGVCLPPPQPPLLAPTALGTGCALWSQQQDLICKPILSTKSAKLIGSGASGSLDEASALSGRAGPVSKSIPSCCLGPLGGGLSSELGRGGRFQERR